MRYTLVLVVSLVLVASIPYQVLAQDEVDKCFNYKMAGDYQRAIEAGKLAVKLYPKYSDAHFCLGDAYRAVGEFKLALSEMKQAEGFAKSKGNLMLISNRIGYIFSSMSNYDDALLYYSRYLSRELRDKGEEATALDNMAGIFSIKVKLIRH